MRPAFVGLPAHELRRFVVCLCTGLADKSPAATASPTSTKTSFTVSPIGPVTVMIPRDDRI
ncbi:MAG: hypothetical protein J6386_16860 [Candidatus Synoicihabitans palmerolidicus]|nr:hypothetical protein [Candidatus Synoicihabitans palmerolidicus]